MKLSELKLNPKNPRIIKDAKFKALCKSLQDFPQMMDLRPIVIDGNKIIQAGNMRFRALKEIGYKEIPDTWVVERDDFSEDQWNEFKIKDNLSMGSWDWDQLANEWNVDMLKEWGMDVPFEDMTQEDMDSKFNNTNCEYPLIPEYDEKYQAFIIICETETEADAVRTKFNFPDKAKSYKNSFLGKSNVLKAKEII